MAIRSTLSQVARQAQMSMSRATIREFSDDHLMQEVKQADVYYSETPSDFERFQQVGMTAFPLKQEEDEKKKSAAKKPEASTAGQPGQPDYNDDQPKGPAAEAVMLYMNGQRSHPIALVDDRRVRPYEMSEGEGAHYAPDGSEQMVLFKETGTYIVSLDNTSVKDKKNKKTRFVSMRHVEKKMQTHKIEENQQAESGGGGSASATPAAATRAGETSGGGGQQKKEKYKHEGDSINTEVRCTKNRIEFRTGDKVVGYYDVQNEEWKHTGKTIKNEAQSISHKGVQYFDKSIHVKETVYASEGLKPGNGDWGAGIPSEGPSLLDASIPGDPIELSPHVAAYVARKQKQADDLEARLAAMEARLAALERAGG